MPVVRKYTGVYCTGYDEVLNTYVICSDISRGSKLTVSQAPLLGSQALSLTNQVDTLEGSFNVKGPFLFHQINTSHGDLNMNNDGSSYYFKYKFGQNSSNPYLFDAYWYAKNLVGSFWSSLGSNVSHLYPCCFPRNITLTFGQEGLISTIDYIVDPPIRTINPPGQITLSAPYDPNNIIIPYGQSDITARSSSWYDFVALIYSYDLSRSYYFLPTDFTVNIQFHFEAFKPTGGLAAHYLSRGYDMQGYQSAYSHIPIQMFKGVTVDIDFKGIMEIGQEQAWGLAEIAPSEMLWPSSGTLGPTVQLPAQGRYNAAYFDILPVFTTVGNSSTSFNDMKTKGLIYGMLQGDSSPSPLNVVGVQITEVQNTMNSGTLHSSFKAKYIIGVQI